MRIPILVVATLLLTAAPSTPAASFSKTYVFKPGTTLDIGVEIEPGLRVDTIRFTLPATVDGKIVRTGGLARADVAISNLGEAWQRIGIAIAALDDEGRLLGVASGGMKLFPLKAGRQATYGLTFENVNAELHKATKFHITIEPRP